MFIQSTMYEMNNVKAPELCYLDLFRPDQRMTLVTEGFKVVFNTLGNVLIRMAAVWRGNEESVLQIHGGLCLYSELQNIILLLRLDWHKISVIFDFYIICVLRCCFIHLVIWELQINFGHDKFPANVPTVVLLWPA